MESWTFHDICFKSLAKPLYKGLCPFKGRKEDPEREILDVAKLAAKVVSDSPHLSHPIPHLIRSHRRPWTAKDKAGQQFQVIAFLSSKCYAGCS